MDQKKYVFVGNREYVLREMIDKGLSISKVWVMENSFLHNKLRKEQFIDYVVIHNKKELIQAIIDTDFDILVSNGCKYILPIFQLKTDKKREDLLFINIHPSYLPDLKGMDPINGACLYYRSGGAACHYMDDGIDTGAIISRIKIPISDDIDAGLLFQLSFKAEVEAFKEAYSMGFAVPDTHIQNDDTIYYTISEQDMVLDCSKGVDYLLRQARAFGYRSKGISVAIENEIYKYFDATEIKNQYVRDAFNGIPEREIGIAFEHSIIFKLNERIIRLNQLTVDNAAMLEGKTID